MDPEAADETHMMKTATDAKIIDWSCIAMINSMKFALNFFQTVKTKVVSEAKVLRCFEKMMILM